MRKDGNGELWYSPTDLVRFVESSFVTFMDRLHLEDPGRAEPDPPDPILGVLAKMGYEHEARYRSALEEAGRSVVEIPRDGDSLARTRAALVDRAEAIFQAHLEDRPFAGYADFLELDAQGEGPSYAIWDTKLAARIKPTYLIQLCAYADMLGAMGASVDRIGVVLGSGEASPYRPDEFRYYVRGLRRALVESMKAFDPDAQPTPEPRADHGRWASHAAARLEALDHPILVAGILRSQIHKLGAVGIDTLTALAKTTLSHVPRLDDGVFERLRSQARLQLASRDRERPAYEVVPPDPDDPRRGLALLPPPSPMDVYFDLEGDPLVEDGLEYLWGAAYLEDGEPAFRDDWAFDHGEEQQAFERFVDWVMARWRRDPSMHVYHYAPYERTVLKRLMGRYASREEEVDHLLRSDILVDLYPIVRQGVRIGTPSYSLKDVETLYRDREGEVTSAGASIVEFERFLLSGEPRDWRRSPILQSLRDYNEVDCHSTRELADWLRARQAESGVEFLPEGDVAEPEERVLEGPALERRRLAERLLAEAADQGDEEARITTLLGQLVEFHRREEKPLWWSFFERHEMTTEQLVDDPTCIGGAVLESGPFPIRRSTGYWYAFDANQDTKVEAGDDVYIAGNTQAKLTVEDMEEGRLRVVVGPSVVQALPAGMPQRCSFLRHKQIGHGPLVESLRRTAEAWDRDRALPAPLHDLLRGAGPTLRGHEGDVLLPPDADVLDGVTRVVRAMDGTTLAIQGPPGSGKTFTGSHVIRELLAGGKNVGVVSNSHAAIHNLMQAVIDRHDGSFTCLKVGTKPDHPFATDNPGVRTSPGGAVGQGAYGGGLVGGTAWFFAHEDMVDRLDYLFVDEAGQVSLANLVAMAPSTRNIVLLGDQMQLSQPIQGTHPGESGKSALDFVLGEHRTVPADLGIFLPRTWRLHPDICSFVSGAIYEGRLEPAPGTERRVVRVPADPGLVPVEAGILFSGVEHDGNAQASDEEVERIEELTRDLLERTRTGDDGKDVGPVTIEDILFVAPFNMQVRRLRAALPDGARVASVDKFQGQQAPVVVVSLCRSAGEGQGSGRGLEFVLDANRLNVAVSRAQSLAIIVGDPRIATGRGGTIDQMRRLNLLAWLLEVGGRNNCV